MNKTNLKKNHWFLKMLARVGLIKQATPPVDLSHNPQTDPTTWWGTFLIGEEQSRFFKIGDRVLCVDRYGQEWRITLRLEDKQPLRSFAAKSSNPLTIRPTLPEKPLLLTLEQPFYLSPSQELTLYLSSPACITLAVGTPTILLDEIPSEALSETWLGPNTLKGELCYTTRRTSAIQLEEHLDNPLRVISPIQIINRSRTPLFIQTIKIPTHALSIYSDENNHLWTEELQFIQEDGLSVLGEPIIKEIPKTLKEARFITPPRTVAKSGLKTLLNPFTRK